MRNWLIKTAEKLFEKHKLTIIISIILCITVIILGTSLLTVGILTWSGAL